MGVQVFVVVTVLAKGVSVGVLREIVVVVVAKVIVVVIVGVDEVAVVGVLLQLHKLLSLLLFLLE